MNEEMIPMDLAKYRLNRAKEDLKDAEFNYNNKSYLTANNRAYYSIFHAIRAVLALERIDFKKHKDVIGYFNGHYIKNEIFPRKINNKIVQARKIREDSDYDDEFVADGEQTKQQLQTAEELINLVEEYIKKQDN